MTKESYLEFIEPIKDNFDVIVTSYHARLAKPERAIYELCAKQLKLDTSECLMVDDSYYNCEGARVAGMEAIEYTDLDNFKKTLAKFLADSDN
jgi:putative hydrolase of the HAD superfamily